MKPISFRVRCRLNVPPQAIFEGIADPESWKSFTGYGPLPGIESVRFLRRDGGMQGAILAVENKDGSRHEEEIVVWQPVEAIEMRLQNFSKPLARFASHFLENWEFNSSEEGDFVLRSFRMYSRRRRYRPVVWIISLLMRRAILRHTLALAAPANAIN